MIKLAVLIRAAEYNLRAQSLISLEVPQQSDATTHTLIKVHPSVLGNTNSKICSQQWEHHCAQVVCNPNLSSASTTENIGRTTTSPSAQEVISFGKFRGFQMGMVQQQQPWYCRWVLKENSPESGEGLQRFATFLKLMGSSHTGESAATADMRWIRP